LVEPSNWQGGKFVGEKDGCQEDGNIVSRSTDEVVVLGKGASDEQQHQGGGHHGQGQGEIGFFLARVRILSAVEEDEGEGECEQQAEAAVQQVDGGIGVEKGGEGFDRDAGEGGDGGGGFEDAADGVTEAGEAAGKADEFGETGDGGGGDVGVGVEGAGGFVGACEVVVEGEGNEENQGTGEEDDVFAQGFEEGKDIVGKGFEGGGVELEENEEGCDRNKNTGIPNRHQKSKNQTRIDQRDPLKLLADPGIE